MRGAVYSLTEGYTRTNLALGRALVAAGRSGEAIAVLEPALRGNLEASNLYVTRTELYEALGDAYAAAGEPAQARDAYARVAGRGRLATRHIESAPLVRHGSLERDVATARWRGNRR